MRLTSKVRTEFDRKLLTTMNDAYDAALYQQAIDIMGLSVLQVPVDTGRLRSSGFVGPPQNHTVKLGYGTNYAAHVHERTETEHSGRTKSKYLSDPIDKKRSTWERDMAKKTRNAVDNNLKWGGGNFPLTSSG